MVFSKSQFLPSFVFLFIECVVKITLSKDIWHFFHLKECKAYHSIGMCQLLFTGILMNQYLFYRRLNPLSPHRLQREISDFQGLFHVARKCWLHKKDCGVPFVLDPD